MTKPNKDIKQIAKEAREWVASEEGQATIKAALEESREVLKKLNVPAAPIDWSKYYANTD